MALTTEPAPDPKKATGRAAADKPDDKLPELVAAPGATDPAVLQLVAEGQTAVSNGDADAIREVNARLNDLGYK